ncbi:C3HC zinc finger-like-domain-containing protein [Coniochaeta sp. 2T2.1]|nr:C3HC zinc finger-like-domain-containing protein [Coniochaeta sp. 2T2.1]
MNSTVKRKFASLIQGISTRPSSAPSAAETEANDNLDQSSIMANDFGLLTKKRRTIEPRSLTPSRLESLQNKDKTPRTPLSKGPTTISNITLRRFTPNGSVPPPAKDAQPKYCPGDRDQLIKRLASFQELTDWTPKPDPVNEVEWAKRGWMCHGKELVRCILCNKELVVKLNRKEVDGREVPVLVASEIEEGLVKKYVELIVESHSEDCLWRKHGCDDSLLRLPLAHPQTALTDLRKRYDELIARKDFLPYEFNLRLPATLNLDTVLSHLPRDFFTNPPPPTTPTPPTTTSPNKPALALALLGWQGLTNPHIGPVLNSASCHTCLRRLGLWMFKSKQVDPETNAVLVPAAMDHLDPLREHRFFCPWKNGHVQRNPGAKPLAKGEEVKPGWEVLATVLKNDAFLRSKMDTPSRAGHGRSKSTIVPGQRAQPDDTPLRRPGTAGRTGDVTPPPGGIDGGEEEFEDEATQARKDKERWARLRKVKSLFNTKGGSRLKRSGTAASSRPGTAGGRPETPGPPATPRRPGTSGSAVGGGS